MPKAQNPLPGGKGGIDTFPSATVNMRKQNTFNMTVLAGGGGQHLLSGLNAVP